MRRRPNVIKDERAGVDLEDDSEESLSLGQKGIKKNKYSFLFHGKAGCFVVALLVFLLVVFLFIIIHSSRVPIPHILLLPHDETKIEENTIQDLHERNEVAKIQTTETLKNKKLSENLNPKDKENSIQDKKPEDSEIKKETEGFEVEKKSEDSEIEKNSEDSENYKKKKILLNEIEFVVPDESIKRPFVEGDWPSKIPEKYHPLPKILIFNTPLWSMRIDATYDCRLPCELTSDKKKLPDAMAIVIRKPGSGIGNPQNLPTLGFTMEPTSYYPTLTYNHLEQSFNASSTYEWESTIPYTFFEWKQPNMIRGGKYNTLSDANVKKKGVFVARNCGSKNNREELVRLLMTYDLVDSVSSCLNNRKWPGSKSKVEVLDEYAFYFAFENSKVKDYVSEKAYDGLDSKAVTVYFGAPNAYDGFFPQRKSVIFVSDFKTYDDLAKYLLYLLQNEEKYLEYHAWRKPEAVWESQFENRMKYHKYHKECRTCDWAFAHSKELKWDKMGQDIIWNDK